MKREKDLIKKEKKREKERKVNQKEQKVKEVNLLKRIKMKKKKQGKKI